MQRLLIAGAFLALAAAGPAVRGADAPVSITIHADQPGPAVPSSLWGIFYEEINHAGDGGIYAEMVMNRAMEELQPAAGARIVGAEMVTPSGFRHPLWYTSELPGWSPVAEGGAAATIHLDDTRPLNEMTPHALRLDVTTAAGGAGVANSGYWGMSVRQGETYNLSLYALTDAPGGEIRAELRSADGSRALASGAVASPTGAWKRYACSLRATATDPRAQLVLTVSRPGRYWLDVVSLFPRATWANRPNGLRRDLVGLLKGMRPAFVRFPGGCVVEGCTLANRIQWKRTVGDIARRPGRWDLWGYHNTEGLGFHEYLQLCEDLGAEPLYVANAGMSCFYRKAEIERDPAAIREHVQDMLDALEYANGPTSSRWGAERARNGHPAPFNIRYVEIGNENWGEDYFRAYRIFYPALKKAWPDVVAIADCPVPDAPVDVVDEHYYVAPDWFFANARKYDQYDRKGPKVYVGEYACNSGVGAGNLLAALSEAAFMTGMERNSDVVRMASYAPLFENVNNRAWPVNLIRFDSSRSCGRSSYQVQKLFAEHQPTRVLGATFADNRGTHALPGSIGLGSWDTQVEYRDITVEAGGRTVYASDFAAGLNGWKAGDGEWSVAGGALRQMARGENKRAVLPGPGWGDCSIRLKARKIAGSEGFLILFRVRDTNNYVWWNIGGWGNSRHAIEQTLDGGKAELGRSVAGGVETGVWNDVRIDLTGTRIVCTLNGRVIHRVDLAARERLFVAAGRDEKRGELILKVVNPTADRLTATIGVAGAAAGRQASIWTLAGDPKSENTLEDPARLVPVRSLGTVRGGAVTHTMPPYSLTVLRIPELRR